MGLKQDTIREPQSACGVEFDVSVMTASLRSRFAFDMFHCNARVLLSFFLPLKFVVLMAWMLTLTQYVIPPPLPSPKNGLCIHVSNLFILTPISVVAVHPPPPKSAYHRFSPCFFPFFRGEWVQLIPSSAGTGVMVKHQSTDKGARGCVRPGMGIVQGEVPAVLPVIVASPDLLVVPVVNFERFAACWKHVWRVLQFE